MIEVGYRIEYDHEREMYVLHIPSTGEIREAKSIELILKSLVKDHGFYLRRIP